MPENSEAELILPVFNENELTFAPTFTLFVTKALLPTPKFNELKLEAYMKFVEIVLAETLHAVSKLVLIEVIFVTPKVVIPATPRVPVLELLPNVASPATPRVPVLELLPNVASPAIPRVPVLELLPNVASPATPRVPVLEVIPKVAFPVTDTVPDPIVKLLADKELVETLHDVTKFVLIVPLLFMFCEVKILPKSSFPTNKLEK